MQGFYLGDKQIDDNDSDKQRYVLVITPDYIRENGDYSTSEKVELEGKK